MTKRLHKELTPAQLATLPDDQIDASDIPELDDAFWRNARLREPEGTMRVTLRVKKSVLDAFKATGKDYRTRMVAALEAYARTSRK